MLAAVDHDRAIDDYRADARRILAWVVVGRPIDDRCGVKQDHVGRLAFAQEAAVRQAERRRGAAGHLGDRLGQGEQAEIAGIVADEPRERAVETRMGLALAGDAIGRHAGPVGADQGGRVGGDGADVGFRHRSHHDAGGALVGDDDVADRVERIAAPLARDLLDGSAGLGGATRRDGDADVGPGVDLAEVVEADFGDFLADARADIRINALPNQARQLLKHFSNIDR